jgi:hypothetical protein
MVLAICFWLAFQIEFADLNSLLPKSAATLAASFSPSAGDRLSCRLVAEAGRLSCRIQLGTCSWSPRCRCDGPLLPLEGLRLVCDSSFAFRFDSSCACCNSQPTAFCTSPPVSANAILAVSSGKPMSMISASARSCGSVACAALLEATFSSHSGVDTPGEGCLGGLSVTGLPRSPRMSSSLAMTGAIDGLGCPLFFFATSASPKGSSSSSNPPIAAVVLDCAWTAAGVLLPLAGPEGGGG